MTCVRVNGGRQDVRVMYTKGRDGQFVRGLRAEPPSSVSEGCYASTPQLGAKTTPQTGSIKNGWAPA